MQVAARADSTPSSDEVRALHRYIDAGFLLPTRWYSDRAIFQAELGRIHRRAWHFATHTGDLQRPGDVYIRNVANVPIVLIRGADEQVRGFINVCRHRGYQVVTAAGNQARLRCAYHGWTYGLDGGLLNAPRSDSDTSFDPGSFGLVPVQVRVWGPMVWVNLDLGAPSFDEWIRGMPELMLEHGLDVADHAFGFDHVWEIEANWKVFQDNTIECYHCPTSHPRLARVLEMKPELQKMAVGGRYWIHHEIPFRASFKGSLTTRPVEGQPFNYYYHWVFPTTYLQFAGRGFDIGSVDVVDVDRIRFRHICFMPIGTPAEKLEQGYEQLAVDQTIHEDVEICRRVQAGHAAGVAPTCRVLPGPEFLLSHFQHVIVGMMGEDPLEESGSP